MRNRITALVAALSLLLSLAACATTASREDTKVQCPKCGYEFDRPSDY